jgi:acetylornithine deacetylase/succinyl-diaminopimelate desuccinylase-like protein
MPPLSRIVNDLERTGNLSRDVATSLKEVLSIANRAVHGELVTAESAEMLSSLGVRLIEELWDIYKEKVSEPSRSVPIDNAYLENLRSSQYRVVTAIPYTKKPVMNLRILDQDGLDEFLEGYEDFAEFLVSIEPIDLDIPESLLPSPATAPIDK